MVAHGAGVALFAVAAPARPQLRRGRRGGRVNPAARTAPSSSARLSAPSSGGGCQPSSSAITASMSSTSISPLT